MAEPYLNLPFNDRHLGFLLLSTMSFLCFCGILNILSVPVSFCLPLWKVISVTMTSSLINTWIYQVSKLVDVSVWIQFQVIETQLKSNLSKKGYLLVHITEKSRGYTSFRHGWIQGHKRCHQDSSLSIFWLYFPLHWLHSLHGRPCWFEVFILQS